MTVLNLTIPPKTQREVVIYTIESENPSRIMIRLNMIHGEQEVLKISAEANG